MNTQRDLELLLRAHYEARAERTVPNGQLDAILDRTAGRRQRPAWLAALRSPTMSVASIAARPAIPRAAWLLVAVGALLVILAGVYATGRHSTPDKPLNGRIVFARYDPRQDALVLTTVNPDGTHLVELRSGQHEGPHWSPDGTQIGFTDAVMNADGSGFRTRDYSQAGLTLAAWDWSPDGERLLMEGWNDAEDESVHGVYTVRASDGGDLRRLDQPGDVGVPGAFSPDGTMVAYNGTFEGSENALIIVNVDGTNRHRLGFVPFGVPAWAPDSRSLLVTASGRIYSIDLATGSTTPIRMQESPEADIWAAEYSPDGTRILFGRHIEGTTRNTDLFTMLLDGTDVVRVTNDPDDSGGFDWGTHPLE